MLEKNYISDLFSMHTFPNDLPCQVCDIIPDKRPESVTSYLLLVTLDITM